MMKTIAEVCVVAAMCFAASSAEAYVVGARRLDKPRKPKQTVKLAECASCAKKFYYARSLNARGYCSSCWCNKHDRAKQLVNRHYICRNCTAEKMRADGTAKCSICSRTSKETKLLYQTNGTLFPIAFYCEDHLCTVHNSPFILYRDKYVCEECEDARREREREIEREQEEARQKAKEEASKKARRLRDQAQSEYELRARIADAAYPEKWCEVHKWKAEYAPRFGGDYYTADAEAKYAQNYMKALELQDKGLLKCMCHDSKRIAYWKECCAKAENAKKKLEQLELECMAEK